MASAATHGTGRDWLTEAGLLVAALAAVISSGAALAGLARLAGWPAWLAVMLPATVDLYAITATRVWLSRRTTSSVVRRYAAANALTGIAASVTGNAAYHGLVAGAVSIPRWLLVVVVSTVPPIVIGALAHLTALRHREAEPATVRRTSNRATSGADRRAERTSGTRAEPDGASRTAGPGVGERANHARRSGSTVVDHAVWGDAVEAYRASVETGEPLSERRLAQAHGLSRRQARKAITAVRDGDQLAARPAAARLQLANEKAPSSGEVA